MNSYWGVDHGEVSKRKKGDYSGTAVGAGGTLATVGFVGGGVPGTKSKANLGDVARARGRKEKITTAGKAYGAGEFGYRHNAHHTYKVFGLGKDHPGNTTAGRIFTHGDQLGRAKAEDKIISHLKVGRRVSNAALVGGAAIAAGGAYQHHKRVSKRKRDNFGANTAIGAGATTAATGTGLGALMDHQGRKWSSRSANALSAAQKANPRLGGFDIKNNGTRVPDIKPHRSNQDIASDHKNVFAGKTKAHAEGIGRLRGEATQGRYFASTYGKFAGVSRKVGLAGAGVAAAGLTAKHIQNRKKVSKGIPRAMPVGQKIRGVAGFTDLRGQIQFSSQLPKLHPGDPQRVLHTVRKPKRKLARVRATATAFERSGA